MRKRSRRRTLERLESRTVLATVLGTGASALLGGDLTDPEGDGVDAQNSGRGSGFNWTAIRSSSESYFSPGGAANEGAFDVFDNKVGAGEAKWCCDGPNQWVGFELSRPHTLTHFTIAAGNDAAGRDPDVWEIQGSNDGDDWSTIFRYDEDGTSPFGARLEVVRYDGEGVDFDTPRPYRWFRYEVTSVVSGGTHQINELEFFGFPGLSVVTTSPADREVVAEPPQTAMVEFSTPIDVSSLQPDDLLVNGIPSTAVRVIDEVSVEFTMPPLSDGTHHLSMEEGAVDPLDDQLQSLIGFTSSFVVPAAARLTNLPATSILADSAVIGAEIVDAGGDDPLLLMYWGDNDGGTDAEQWDNVVDLGVVGVGETVVLIDGLEGNTEYFYRALSNNVTGERWSSTTTTFRSLTLTLPTLETNAVSIVGPFSAAVSGRVVDIGGDPPTVEVFYGESDGGTDASAWDHATFVGESIDDFGITVSGLIPDTTYHFRTRATNAAGSEWSSSRTFTTIERPVVAISEFVAVNLTTLPTRTRDQGDLPFEGPERTYDWIEIQNLSDSPVDIGGLYLTDDQGDPNKWQIPFGTVIDANDQIVMFASGLDIRDPDLDELGLLHMNFSLDGAGEYLAIGNANGDAIDEFTPRFPQQIADVAYGVARGTTQYLASATPQEPNTVAGLDVVANVTTSVQRGFFDEPFDVELATETPDATIRYTLDGSDPTEVHGEEYTGPVQIDRTTTLRVVASRPGWQATPIQTHTYLFVDDVITQTHESTVAAGFPETWLGQEPDYGMDPDVIGPEDQFDGAYAATIRDDLQAIPTISIVTDVDRLFGQRGIYSNPGDVSLEVPTSIEMITADGSEEFQINAGIKIQGGAFRSFGLTRKKSFRLKFKSEYGASKLEYPFFGESAADEFDTITLRMNANDGWQWADAGTITQYMRDEFGRRTQLAMGQPASRGRHVHVYLNGVYWGMYNAVERPDQTFGESYVGGDKDDWDGINAGRAINSDGDPARTARTNEAWAELLRLTSAVAEAETQAEKTAALMRVQGLNPDGTDNPAYEDYLDVENMIDYMIVNFYGGNSDWPHKNYYVGRESGPDSTGFKFFMWDSEWSLGLRSGVNTNRISQVSGVAAPFQNLRSSDHFRLMFADRVQKHFFNGGSLYVDPNRPFFDPDRSGNNIPAATYVGISNEIRQSLVAESARWGDQHRRTPYTRDGEWQREFENLLANWFPQRSFVLMDHFRSAELYPEIIAPEFLVDGKDQHGGEILPESTLTMTAPVEVVTDDTVLLTQGHSAQYFVPADDTLETGGGPRWFAADFDAQGWHEGVSGFGFQSGTAFDGLIETDIKSVWDLTRTSVYTRFEFSLDQDFSAEEFDQLVLRMKYDDGFVAYLNGEPVVQRNAPLDVAWDSRATASHRNSLAVEFEDFTITDLGDRLQPGTNVLAIHLLNRSPSNADLLLIPELVLKKVTSVINAPIYYTLDGSDPRGLDGSVQGTLFDGELTLPSTVTLRARSFDGSAWSALEEAQFVVDPATPGELLISEINYHPASPTASELAKLPNLDDDDFEFLELHNASDRSVSLAGLEIVDGVEFQFPDVDLAAGQYAIVVRNPAAFELRYGSHEHVIGRYDGGLANDGEVIQVVDAVGNALFRVEYDDNSLWSARADGIGGTLELMSAETNPDEVGEWYRWQGSYRAGGSPGASTTTAPGVIVNEVVSRGSVEVDAIELFNATSTDIDIGGWYLSDDADDLQKYQFPVGTMIAGNSYLVVRESLFGAGDRGFGLSGTGGDEVWLTTVDETGITNGFSDNVDFRAAREDEPFGRIANVNGRLVPLEGISLGSTNLGPRVGPVVISEIQYAPSEPSPSAIALDPTLTRQELEFVEIVNTSRNAVSLADWRLRGGIDADLPSRSLAAGESLVIVSFNPDDLIDVRKAAAFRAHYGLSEDVTLVGGFAGQLSNDGESLVLLRAEPADGDPSRVVHTVEDDVVYDDRNPWPTDVATNGNSLTRVVLTGVGGESDRWTSRRASPGVSALSNDTDFNGDGTVDVADVDLFCEGYRADQIAFDVNGDGLLSELDIISLMDSLGAVVGDANLDGAFDSQDLVALFIAAEYEDGTPLNSTWASGDWDCDGDFTSEDLVFAFRMGGYTSSAQSIASLAAAVDFDRTSRSKQQTEATDKVFAVSNDSVFRNSEGDSV